MTNLQLQYHRKIQFSIYQQTKNHLFCRRTGYLSVSILRIIAYSIIALNMLKMQMTMYLQKWVLHASYCSCIDQRTNHSAPGHLVHVGPALGWARITSGAFGKNTCRKLGVCIKSCDLLTLG